MKQKIGKLIAVILGLSMTLVVFEVSMRLGVGLYAFWKEEQNRVRLQKTGVCRIVCFGDSMTEKTYPVLLEEKLNQLSSDHKYVVIDKGKSATDSDYIVNIFSETLDKYKPDIVVCMMGFNDHGDVLPYGQISFRGKKYFYSYRLIRFLWYAAIQRWQARWHNDSETVRSQTAKRMTADRALDYRETFEDQEYVLTQKIAEYPKNERLYARLGWLYWKYNMYDKAEEVYSQMIIINPQSAWAYTELGQCYRDRGLFEQSRQMYEKAIAAEPEKKFGYEKLAWYYGEQRKRELAVTVYERAIAANPKAIWAYTALGGWYMEYGQYELADKAFQMAEDLYEYCLEDRDPLYNPYNERAICYSQQGKYAEAIAVLLRDITTHPNKQHNYALLAKMYELKGDTVQADKYSQKGKEQKIGSIHKKTRNNYQIIKDEALRRGITLVCMQYPMLNIEHLKILVTPLEQGVVLVDNEMIFRDAVSHGLYSDFFIDSYGGVFGHFTGKGVELITANLAKTIFGILYRAQEHEVF